MKNLDWRKELYDGWKYDACTGIIPRIKWDLHEGDTFLDMEYFIDELLKKLESEWKKDYSYKKGILEGEKRMRELSY